MLCAWSRLPTGVSFCELNVMPARKGAWQPERLLHVSVTYMAEPARILYCHCAYARIIPPDVKTEVLTRLASSSVEWDSVPDLCEMAARRDAHIATLISGGALRIAACYPRVVRSLFQAAGAPLPPDTQILNMRTGTPAQIIQGLLEEGQ